MNHKLSEILLDNCFRFIKMNKKKKCYEKTFSYSVTRYGQSTIGKVEFRSGFVVSIESAMTEKTSYRDVCSETEVSDISD